MKKLIALSSVLVLAGCAPYQTYCPLHTCKKPAPAPAPVVAAPVVIAPVSKTILISKPITITGVNFKVNSAKLLDRDLPVLDQVAAFAHAHPSALLTVNGYCSRTGTYAYNQQLSERRAQSVAHYLKDHGVTDQRMLIKGHSYNDPVASNATPQGRFENQRVEVNSTIKVKKIIH